MDKKLFSLTKNELEIMDFLWSEGRPLSRSEIIELPENRSWKASSIHILLNQLLEKEAIQVDGFVKTGKNYGRTFSPLISKDDYQMMQLQNNIDLFQPKGSVLVDLVSSLIQDEEIDEKSINRLEAMLQNKRSQKK